jgi:hypothetical protein
MERTLRTATAARTSRGCILLRATVLACVLARGSGTAGEPEGSPWPKPLGGPGDEAALAIAADGQGNLYTAGRFAGSAAFDAIRLASAGGSDLFLARLDASAHVAWAVGIGGTGADEARGIAVGPAGDVYVTGSFSGTVDFDPGPGRAELTSAGATDAFLLRVDAQGALVWARRLGGKLTDAGLRVAAGADAVWVTGFFGGTLTIDPLTVGSLTIKPEPAPAQKLESAGGTDGFIAKLNLDGNLVWARRIGGAKDDEGRGIAAGRKGEVWIAGTFQESPSLGPDLGALDFHSAGKADVFLLRLDAAGKLLWSGRLGGEKEEQCEGLTATVAGGAALIGEFREKADIDPGPGSLSVVSHGVTDAFLVRVDGNGGLVWGHGFGETGADTGLAVTGDRFGSVYAVGTLERRQREGGSLAWIAEYSDSGERAWSLPLQATDGLQALAITLDAAGATAVAGSFRGETKELREAAAGRIKGFGKTDAFVWRLVPMAKPRP